MGIKIEHYFICSPCALKKGGEHAAGVCTVHKGICKYCNTEATLYAWNDFDYPKDRELTLKAENARD